MRECRRIKIEKGFTIIEVSIFLGITGLMLIGLLAGVGIRVATQRYNDAVQDAEEFFRSVYSEVINVQNSREDVAFNSQYCSGPNQLANLSATVSFSDIIVKNSSPTSSLHAGRTRCAIYGKLVTFNEKNDGVVRVYSVIGKLDADQSNDIPSVFRSIYADAYAYDFSGGSTTQCIVSSAGTFRTYTPAWDASLEVTDSHDKYSGAMMIIRSPVSNAVYTYKLEDGLAINIASKISDGAFSCSDMSTINSGIKGIHYYLGTDDASNHFVTGDINFCINSPDILAAGNKRRNIRILSDGRNASAVKLVEADSGENLCV